MKDITSLGEALVRIAQLEKKVKKLEGPKFSPENPSVKQVLAAIHAAEEPISSRAIVNAVKGVREAYIYLILADLHRAKLVDRNGTHRRYRYWIPGSAVELSMRASANAGEHNELGEGAPMPPVPQPPGAGTLPSSAAPEVARKDPRSKQTDADSSDAPTKEGS